MQDPQQLLRAFEAYSEQQNIKREPEGLYTPIDYIMSSGGKRLRPLLSLMGAHLFSARPAEALPVAMAVEIFHNFSLVHDDIMDEAPLRRGRPSVHELYGLNAGILSGDAMLILAYEYLSRAGSDAAASGQLLRLFNEVALEVCEGQQYDMEFESRNDVTIEEYLRMIELKTAALIGGSLQMGAVAVGAPEADARQLRQFGRGIGVAFQLQDDMLDTFGDPERFGKRVGGDIVQNKKTFLILKAQQLAKGADARRLQELMQSHPEDEQAKVEEVTALLRSLHIPEWAAEQKQAFQNQAFAALAAVNTLDDRKVPLRELAEQLLERQA
jgi:geranylgeranyl diphosphate synthase, type II